MRLTEQRYLEQWLVICNEEDTDGPAKVLTNEKRVLHVDGITDQIV